MGGQQLVGEIVVFVNDDVDRGGAGVADCAKDVAQPVGSGFDSGRAGEIGVSAVFSREDLEGIPAGQIEGGLQAFHVEFHPDHGEIEAHDELGIVCRGGVAADIGVGEELLEAVFAVDVVVAFEDGTPEAFAEAPGAEHDGDLVVFQLADKAGLVHKMIASLDDFLVVGHRIWNPSLHVFDYIRPNKPRATVF